MKSTEKNDPLLSALRSFFGRRKIEGGMKILSALSGGPDSTALSLGLVLLREELGYSLEIAHYDHGIRRPEDSERELDFSRRFAERYAVPLRIGRADPGTVQEFAKEQKKSLEDAAREFRYRFLQSARTESLCDYIALGHILEDRLETQIFRMFQGSSYFGLEGIRERRGNIIRPILTLSKKDVLHFLKLRGESYCSDQSNESLRFLRNKVRLKLFPMLEEIFPGYPAALDKLSFKAGIYRDFIEKSLLQNNPWKKGTPYWECEKKAFLDLHPVLRIHSLYGLYNRDRSARKEKRLPFPYFSPLMNDGNFSKNGILLEGHGARLEIWGNKLFWKTDIVLERKKGYLYLIDGPTTVVSEGNFKLRVEDIHPEASTEEDVFPCGKDGFLILRSRRQGDVMLTGSGHKTLKKLLSDFKIPESLRDTVPVLQNSREIIGLFLHPFGPRTIRAPLSGNREPEKIKYLRFIIERIGEESG